MSSPSIQTVVFREEERWVAQCLEYDCATQTDSLDGLYDKLSRLLAVYLGLAAEQETPHSPASRRRPGATGRCTSARAYASNQ